jgi:hypothetical protein
MHASGFNLLRSTDPRASI